MPKSNRHRAIVIETYQDGSAAVKFTSGRIEHILHRGLIPPFSIGQRGVVDFVRTMNGYVWTFDAKVSK